MTNLKPSESLDNWREYFRRGDSDIFGIIDHAIMVAAADCPKEFKSRRDRIAEFLFSCKMSHCIATRDIEVNNVLRTVETVGVGGGCRDTFGVVRDDGEDETKPNKNQIVSNHSYGEADALSDELGKEAFVIVDEIRRIKDILLNKDNEPNSVLLESLRKLESITMTVDILKDTEIGKAVTGLRKHISDNISQLAKTLFAEWKKLVDQWLNTPKEMAGVEGTPQSANISIVDQAQVFPSPPHDLDIFAPESKEFELSKILDCLDCDGNPRHSVESKHERKLQSSVRRRHEGINEANVVERYNKNQKMRRDEADVRPKKHSATGFDEPRRQPKQSREEMVPIVQRKPLVVAEQKRKLAEPQQDKLKALDQEARFESTKRKLQESYRQHENARRQRMIQVLETIPKPSKPQKPQLKRTARR